MDIFMIFVKKRSKYLHNSQKMSTFAAFSGMRGLKKAPHFFINNVLMITKEALKTYVEEWLAKGDYFLVDIQMGDDERIVIEIDHADGVWIEDCAELSRFLQERVGEELGNYELEVGSAGLGQPFKVVQQYENHVGDEVEVITADGKKVTGVLKQVEGRQFTLTTIEKQIPEGKKRPVKVEVDKQFSMDEVKSTKYVLNFK